MGDRHYYGRDGSYRGSSSNQGPWDHWFKIVAALFVLFLISRGCR